GNPVSPTSPLLHRCGGTSRFPRVPLPNSWARGLPMSELLTEERIEELELPDELPVLPLKETVVFPQSMTPLAIGQERSIKLIEDAVDGERLVALVTVKNQ